MDQRNDSARVTYARINKKQQSCYFPLGLVLYAEGLCSCALRSYSLTTLVRQFVSDCVCSTHACETVVTLSIYSFRVLLAPPTSAKISALGRAERVTADVNRNTE